MLPNHPSYPSASEATQLEAQVVEAGLSRIYGGIHYPFDIEAGQTLGRATAEWAMAYDRQHGLLAAVGLDERKDR